MTVAIIQPQLDGTGTLIGLRAVDSANPLVQQSISAFNTAATLTLHVDGTAYSFSLANINTALLHGLNDQANSGTQGRWNSCMLRLDQHSLTMTASNVLVLDLPAGWATAGGVSLPAQPGLSVQNNVAAGTMLPTITGPTRMHIGGQIAPYISYFQTSPFYRSLCAGMFDWFNQTGTVGATMDPTTGLITNLNGGTFYTQMFAGIVHGNAPKGYPHLPSSGSLKVLWTCSASDAPGVPPQGPSAGTGAGFALTSANGDTFTYNASKSTLTGTTRTLWIDYTSNPSFYAPQINLYCNTQTATSLKVIRVIYQSDGVTEVDPNGNLVWDPAITDKFTGKYIIRWMSPDYITLRQGAIDSTDVPPAGQVSLYVNNLNNLGWNVAQIAAYPNLDGAVATGGVPIVVTTCIGNTTPVAHQHREGQTIQFGGLDGNGTPAYPMQVWRPAPGRPFGNSLRSGATSGTIVDCGNAAALNGSGSFTIEITFQFNSIATPSSNQVLMSQALGGAMDRFEIYRDTLNQINVRIFTNGGGSYRINTNPINDTGSPQPHYMAIDCNTDRSSIDRDGTNDQTMTAAAYGGPTGLRSDADGSVHLSLFGRPDGSMPFDGQLDEARITFGTYAPRYGTESYAPTSAPFVPDAGTAILLHCDAIASGASVYDPAGGSLGLLVGQANAGPNPPTLVPSPWSGFGQAISIIDGDLADKASGADFGLNAVATLKPPFTFECKFQRAATVGVQMALMGMWNDVNAPITTYIFAGISSGNFPFWLFTDGSGTFIQITSATAITDTNKHDFAGTFDGTTSQLFIDGVSVGTANTTHGYNTNANTTTNFCVGCYYHGLAGTHENTFVGIIDAVRVSRSVRYTANYTPSSTPFVVDPATVFLADFERIVPSSATPDAGPNALDSMLVGSTLPTLMSPSFMYVAPGNPTNIGPLYFGGGVYQLTGIIHVVSPTQFAFGVWPPANTWSYQPGDYISASPTGAPNTPYVVYANETGGGHAVTSWNSRNMVRLSDKIAMSNQLGANLHLNFAPGATDQYVADCFNQIGNASTGLSRSLFTVIEYMNEPWNPYFMTTQFIMNQASIALTAGNPMGLTPTNVAQASQEWYCYRAHQIYLKAVATMEAIQTGLGANVKLALGGPPYETGQHCITQLNYAYNRGFIRDISYYLMAQYLDNLEDPNLNNWFDIATIQQRMSLTEWYLPESQPTYWVYAYRLALDQFAAGPAGYAPQLAMYEGGTQDMGNTTSGPAGTLASRSRQVARDPAIYNIYMNTMYRWDMNGKVAYFADYSMTQEVYQSNQSADPTAPASMWGKQTTYKNNALPGTGVPPSLNNNRTVGVDNLDTVEAPVAYALVQYQGLTTGSPAATTFTISGARTGTVGMDSAPITWTFDHPFSGTFTPTMGTIPGAYTPASFTLTNAPSCSATYKATAPGTGQISGTANPALTAPPAVAFTAAEGIPRMPIAALVSSSYVPQGT